MNFFNIFKKYFIITFYVYLISVALSNFYFIFEVFLSSKNNFYFMKYKLQIILFILNLVFSHIRRK